MLLISTVVVLVRKLNLFEDLEFKLSLMRESPEGGGEHWVQ